METAGGSDESALDGAFGKFVAGGEVGLVGAGAEGVVLEGGHRVDVFVGGGELLVDGGKQRGVAGGGGAPLRLVGGEVAVDLAEEMGAFAIGAGNAQAEGEILRGVGDELGFPALGDGVDGGGVVELQLRVILVAGDAAGGEEGIVDVKHRRSSEGGGSIHRETVGDDGRIFGLLRLVGVETEEKTLIAEEIDHHAVVMAETFGGWRSFSRGQHGAVETGRAAVFRLVIEKGNARRGVEDAAGSEGRGGILVGLDRAVEIPRVEDETSGRVARILGVGDAALAKGIKRDAVDAVAESGDEAVLPPVALRGEHERAGVLDRVRVGAGAGGEGRVIGNTVAHEGRHFLRGVRRVVGREIALGHVASAPRLVAGAVGRGGIVDRETVLIGEDFVFPATEAVLLGGFGETGQTVAAKPFAEVELPRGARAHGVVDVLERVAAPVVFEVNLAGVGIGERGGSGRGRGEIKVGIAGEKEVGVDVTAGEDAVDVVKIGELEGNVFRDPLLDFALIIDEALGAQAAGAGQVVSVTHESRGDEGGARGASAEEFGREIYDLIVLGEKRPTIAGAQRGGGGDDGRVRSGAAGSEPRRQRVRGVPRERNVVG